MFSQKKIGIDDRSQCCRSSGFKAWRAEQSAIIEREHVHQAALDKEHDKNMRAAAKMQEDDSVMAVFNSLDSSKQKSLLAEFSEHLLASNSAVHRFYW